MTDRPQQLQDMAKMRLAPAEVIARRSSNPGAFEQLFYSNRGRPVMKWLQYLPFYDQTFAPYRGKPVRMLEIGVHKGGSLEMWRRYFGRQAVLFGIDIDPACADRADPPNQVRIGSQADPEFLTRVVDEMGGVDIVLDDGSHVASHQRTSFRTLWPRLSVGGVYVIEDLHTAYWPDWEGGYRRPGTGIELIKDLMDDMHAWFHQEPYRAAAREEIGQISMVDSIAAVHKVARPHPGWASIGQPD